MTTRMSQPMTTMVSQLTDECYTPPEHMDLWRQVLGPIDLDPASCAVANRTVQATRYYTKAEDGYMRPWTCRTLFLNPPYTKNQVNRWVRRLRAAYADGHIAEAAGLLVNSAPGYGWWHELIQSMPVVILSQRLTFIREDGTPYPDHHKKGQTVGYLGRDVRRFLDVFGPLGQAILPGPFLAELRDRLDTLTRVAVEARERVADLTTYHTLTRVIALADLASGSAEKVGGGLGPMPAPWEEVRDAAAE